MLSPSLEEKEKMLSLLYQAVNHKKKKTLLEYTTLSPWHRGAATRWWKSFFFLCDARGK